MKYLILCFAAGLIIGTLAVYIWNRTHSVGSLLIFDEEDAATTGMGPSVWLELEEDFPKFRKKHTVTLRVENRSYYENQK
jgi:hypothetical protein